MLVRVASVFNLALLATWITLGISSLTTPLKVDLYQEELKQLLQQLMLKVQVERCLTIITDDLHSPIYNKAYFEAVLQQPRTCYMLRINDSENLNNPPLEIKQMLQGIKSSGCDMHIITLLNGLQVQQLIKYVYNQRALHMQHKFVLLHDARLYNLEMLHVWSVFVKTLFLRRYQQQTSFSISTISYPGILRGVLVLQQLGIWSPGKHLDGKSFFKDKTRNLRGAPLTVAIDEHMPMVQLNRSTMTYEGVEVMIMEALAKTLNFQPHYYIVNKSDEIELDQMLEENKTRLGSRLIGEVAHHNARFGIGDLHLFQSYMQHVELSLQHSVECLTFLTPESSTDNSWQTFILPFSRGMWTGVILSLFVVGTIFYLISFLNAFLQNSSQASTFFRCFRRCQNRKRKPRSSHYWRRLSLRIELGRYRGRGTAAGRELFDDYANCILLTYSMLLYVALPRMPHHWPLRVLTGWYWIYCILLVATYRASFTAILANPAARVTIDTLQDLNRARIPPTTGSNENIQFFLDSSDDTAREVGAKMEIVEPIDDLSERIARGQAAYYDNEFYLRYLRAAAEARGMESTALHIMKECVVHMPVVLALEKNSALKSHVDDIIQRLSEGGFISKWLQDAIQRLPAEEQAPQEALMNLNKFWSSFMALGIGYMISICAILIEHWHFKHIVKQHPLYDVYNPSIYYNYKRLHPDE